jgi:DNA-directed RNA polymerase specialized sigma24 family protein
MAGPSRAYEAALARLPEAYSTVLRLTDAATPVDDICRHLGIEPESLEPLLEIARRKLRTALSELT